MPGSSKKLKSGVSEEAQMLYSCPSVSAGDWFQEIPGVPDSTDAQVSYIEWQSTGTSLVVQWLRLRFPVQGVWV